LCGEKFSLPHFFYALNTIAISWLSTRNTFSALEKIRRCKNQVNAETGCCWAFQRHDAISMRHDVAGVIYCCVRHIHCQHLINIWKKTSKFYLKYFLVEEFLFNIVKGLYLLTHLL